MSRKIPSNREIKSERVTVAVTPSLAKTIAALAEAYGVTSSELVASVLESFAHKHEAVAASFIADKERLLASYEGKVTIDAATSIPIAMESDSVAEN